MRRLFTVPFEFCQWLKKDFWWLILPASLWLAHIFIVVRILNLEIDGEFSEFIFLVAQIIGVYLVLKSINSNLKVFGSSLKEIIVDKPLRRMPKFKKRKVKAVPLDGKGMSIGDVNVSIFTTKTPQSLEEKIDYLTQKIRQLEKDYRSEFNDIRNLIHEKDLELSQKISLMKSDVKNIESKTKEIAIGGVKESIFGILIAMHGSFVEVIFPVVKRTFFP
jgi:hypothetical protein